MSRIFKPGDTYSTTFTTSSATGAAVNADTLPTASLYRNGAADGAVTVTVTNAATGVYKAAATIPGGYTGGDVVELLIGATIGGVATKAIVDKLRLQGGDLDVSVSTRLPTSSYVAPTAAPTAQAVADAVMDLENVEAGLTFRQWLRLGGSVLFGKSNNTGDNFRDYNDTKNRITATVDANGNRTLVTRDAT